MLAFTTRGELACAEYRYAGCDRPENQDVAAMDCLAGGMQVKLVPRDQRTRSSDQIAQDLRRRLSGIPGAIVRANPGGGNFQLNFILGGGQGTPRRVRR